MVKGIIVPLFSFLITQYPIEMTSVFIIEHGHHRGCSSADIIKIFNNQDYTRISVSDEDKETLNRIINYSKKQKKIKLTSPKFRKIAPCDSLLFIEACVKKSIMQMVIVFDANRSKAVIWDFFNHLEYKITIRDDIEWLYQLNKRINSLNAN